MSFASIPPNRKKVDEEKSVSTEWMDWFTNVWRITDALTQSGTTSQRPTKYLWIGRMYYDTTLSKPIWVNTTSPVVWKDAAGTTV